jgi:hypothetical protein
MLNDIMAIATTMWLRGAPLIAIPFTESYARRVELCDLHIRAERQSELAFITPIMSTSIVNRPISPPVGSVLAFKVKDIGTSSIGRDLKTFREAFGDRKRTHIRLVADSSGTGGEFSIDFGRDSQLIFNPPESSLNADSVLEVHHIHPYKSTVFTRDQDSKVICIYPNSELKEDDEGKMWLVRYGHLDSGTPSPEYTESQRTKREFLVTSSTQARLLSYGPPILQYGPTGTTSTASV